MVLVGEVEFDLVDLGDGVEDSLRHQPPLVLDRCRPIAEETLHH